MEVKVKVGCPQSRGAGPGSAMEARGQPKSLWAGLGRAGQGWAGFAQTNFGPLSNEVESLIVNRAFSESPFSSL